MSTSEASRRQVEIVVSKAIRLVDEEMSRLRENRLRDHGEVLEGKNMVAFELASMVKLAEEIAPDEVLRERFAELARKLELNKKLLEVHISASRQIIGLLADVVRATESDGTYDVDLAARRRLW